MDHLVPTQINIMSYFFGTLRYHRLAVLAALTVSCDSYGFTKTGSVYTTDGSQSDVSAAIANASAGNTVLIPAGSFTWGAGATFISVNKAIVLAGAGTASTTVNLDPTAGSFSNGAIQLSAPAVVRAFTILTPTSSGSPAAFDVTSTATGFRITNIAYVCGSTDPASDHASYAIYSDAYGLIDNCTFVTGATGTQETIFARGPTNSWQTPNSLGTANALYVEDCTFSGAGYVCDINDNGRAVFRFNTINGTDKIDGHGYASNSLRGVRQMEVYDNNWTMAFGFFPTIEIRGGTGMIFDNVSADAQNNGGWLFLEDYGYLSQWPNFGNVYQTPLNYPIGDQVGTGQDVTIASTAITAYEMVTILSVGTTDFTTIGSPNNLVGTRFIATGAGTGSGTVSHTPAAAEPMYVVNNIQNAAPWPRTFKTIAAGAISLYQTQTANPAATFTESTLIQSNRDFFSDAGFDTNVGVSRGTTAQMNALTPSVVGYGFWVTDQGNWNLLLGGFSGQLYTWSGSAWVLKYTPYVYPHPLRRPIAPSILLIGP